MWNVETGHATCKMSVTWRGRETIVWCLAVLSDGTVVSGDSFGRLAFWDSNMGDQVIISIPKLNCLYHHLNECYIP